MQNKRIFILSNNNATNSRISDVNKRRSSKNINKNIDKRT